MLRQQTGHSRASLFAVAVVILSLQGLSCKAGDQGRGVEPRASFAGVPAGVSEASLNFDLTGLSPNLREELKKIRVLVVRDENASDIWLLSEKPDNADVVLLACSPDSLSTDMVTVLEQWASKGRGLIVVGELFAIVWPHLSPAGFRPFDNKWSYAPVPVPGENITAQVTRVQGFLWCAFGSGSVQIYRSEDLPPRSSYSDRALTHSEILAVLEREGEMFSPVVVRNSGHVKGVGYYPLLLFATTWNGARIAWLAGSITDRRARNCKSIGDDARLWSNLAHWLSGK